MNKTACNENTSQLMVGGPTFICFMYMNSIAGVKRFSSGTFSLNWDPRGVLKARNLSANNPVAFLGQFSHLFGMGPGSLCAMIYGGSN